MITFVGYNYRWAPLVQYAKQLLDQQRLGAITHYRGRFFAGYASDPNSVLSWRFLQDQAGFGTLGDLMSHVVDMAQMLSGPVRRVVAQRKTFIPRRPMAVPGTGTHFTTRSDGERATLRMKTMWARWWNSRMEHAALSRSAEPSRVQNVRWLSSLTARKAPSAGTSNA